MPKQGPARRAPSRDVKCHGMSWKKCHDIFQFHRSLSELSSVSITNLKLWLIDVDWWFRRPIFIAGDDDISKLSNDIFMTFYIPVCSPVNWSIFLNEVKLYELSLLFCYSYIVWLVYIYMVTPCSRECVCWCFCNIKLTLYCVIIQKFVVLCVHTR